VADDGRSLIYGIPLQLIIPATPLLGYGYAFLFAWGRASYFQLPVDLISLDLTSVVQATIILIAIFVATVFIAAMYALEMSAGSQHLPRWANSFVHHLTIPSLIALFFLFLGGTQRYSDALLPLGIAVFWAVTATLGDREQDARPRNARLRAIARRVGREYMTVAFYMLVLGLVTYLAGATRAQNQTTFKVNAANQDQVLLAIYSHNVAVFGYVDNKEELTGQLTIVKLGDDPKLLLKSRTFAGGIAIAKDG
jgi:hypothetical protein